MNKLIIILLVLICFIVSACGTIQDPSSVSQPQGEEEPHITGLIYNVSESSILVVEGIASVDMDQSEWEGKDAISFSLSDETSILDRDNVEISKEELQKGDKVEAWHTGTVLESYPLQAEAVKVRKLN
ncbi:DUF3221 domain-containing protein [Evansella tamaricis]|uniref:YobA family protein n=1 Tax=Evansella tamaricis TaxID=2069301 RepID=A0ABS6JDP4_9BACI|nr:DUF3221 domain-containing protein [Evansella tamaricis]MBU9711771.1 YobA family protein [Evansella tamaricis]